MSRLKLSIVLAAVLALMNVGSAEQEKEDSTICLAIDLADGSHVIGVPSIDSISVRTTYAKVSIPVKQILSITMADDRETATFVLQNGDTLKGVYSLASLKLKTIFGEAFIPIKHVTTISVLRGSAGGPVLHYTFDRDENGKVLDKGRRGLHGVIAGPVRYQDSIKGKGIKTSSRDTYVICRSKNLSLDGCIEGGSGLIGNKNLRVAG